MTDSHHLAVFAARETRTDFPLDDHPVVAHLTTRHHTFVATLDDVGDALNLVDALAQVAAPEAITLIVEAYTADLVDPDTPPIPGTLQARHEHGDPDVTAILLVATVTLAGFEHTALAYRVDDDAQITWDDPDEGTFSAGDIPDRMNAAFLAALTSTPGPDATLEHLVLEAIAGGLRALGLGVVVTPLPSTP